MKKRIIFIIMLALLLLLQGCDVAAPKPENTTPITIGATQSEPKYLFAVSPDTAEAAKIFCEKVWELSGNTLSIGVIEAARPYYSLINSDAALAFLTTREIQPYNDCLDVFHAPFTFRDYTHFTMSANYQTLLEIINSEMSSLHVSGGFYTGTSFFLATQSLDSQQDLLSLFFDEEHIPVALTLPSSQIAGGLRRIGFEVVETNSADTRLAQLTDTENQAVIAEFTARELVSSGEWLNSSLTFINAPHNFSAMWLTGSKSFYSELTPRQAAAVQEATSFLFPVLDESNLRDESRIRMALTEEGYKISNLPDAFRTACNNAYYSAFEPSTLRDFALSQIVGIRR